MKNIISSKKFALILSHQGPDGDSIGSSLALSGYLNKIGVLNKVIVPDSIPKNLGWLTNIDQIVVASENINLVNEYFNSADLIFCLDFNHRSRVGPILSPFLNNVNDSVFKIVIDHHTYPENFGDHEIIDSTSSSTSELIYGFIEANNDLDIIDVEIGTAIYLGLISDTGSFKFSSVIPKTHKIASHLIEIGVNHTLVHNNVYDQNNISKINLLGYALQKIKVDSSSSLAYLTLSNSELNNFNYKKGDTEGFVNYCLSIKGVEVAAFLREDSDVIKISFRSKGNIKVNDFSKVYYNGGGHQNAAGALVSNNDLDKALDDLIKNFRSFCLKK